jgi:ketosteroid isomerase-like protein
MSEENLEIVRRVYEGVNSRDTAAVLALYDPDVEWEFARSPFRAFVRHDTYRGFDGLRAFLRERYEDAWQSIDDHLDELIDAGDHVITVVTSRGRGRASGLDVERTHAGLWSLRDGKIVRVAWFPTRAEALEAAGLSE